MRFAVDEIIHGDKVESVQRREGGVSCGNPDAVNDGLLQRDTQKGKTGHTRRVEDSLFAQAVVVKVKKLNRGRTGQIDVGEERPEPAHGSRLIGAGYKESYIHDVTVDGGKEFLGTEHGKTAWKRGIDAAKANRRSRARVCTDPECGSRRFKYGAASRIGIEEVSRQIVRVGESGRHPVPIDFPATACERATHAVVRSEIVSEAIDGTLNRCGVRTGGRIDGDS